MKIEETKNHESPSVATAAIALVLGAFILTTMGFSSSVYRTGNLPQPSIREQNTTLLANRDVFVGVDTSFAAYQNAMQQ